MCSNSCRAANIQRGHNGGVTSNRTRAFQIALVLVCMLEACDQYGGLDPRCHCLSDRSPATLELPCAAPESPQARIVEGACYVASDASTKAEPVALASDEAGLCRVELSFADGNTFSAQVNFAWEWVPCSSDPHGCGRRLVAKPLRTQIGEPCAEAGAGSRASK